MLHHGMERRLVSVTCPFAICIADSPIHAPAAVASAVCAKQVLQVRPEVRRERDDFNAHEIGNPSASEDLQANRSVHWR